MIKKSDMILCSTKRLELRGIFSPFTLNNLDEKNNWLHGQWIIYQDRRNFSGQNTAQVKC